MLFFNWLLVTSVVILAIPLPRHEVDDLIFEEGEVGPHLLKRQNPTVAITGIKSYGIQPRLEIRQLEAKPDQWNIFLLGLERFQQTDQSNLTSYYQIAGIHGRPYIPWDDVPPAEGQSSPGYCTHVSNIFLPWHRPYLALFEQELFQHIIDAVNEFPTGAQRQKYAAAALTWRWPYWDWAAPPPEGEGVYPWSLQTPTVNVTKPNGTEEIPNPLYSYQFHPVSVEDFYFNPFATWGETKRFPNSWELDAYSQNNLIGPVLDNNRISFMDRLYNLFTNSHNFTEFGNEAWMSPGAQNADSLESLHDAIHSITGSNGHMTYLDYSAYDPIFFLHHAMIDRCLALWQALNKDSWVQPMAAIEQTYSTKIGAMIDENSPLEPFFSDQQRDFWTSASVRNIETFGYTYPELAGRANDSAVKEAINKLYGGTLGSSGLVKRVPAPNAKSDDPIPYSDSDPEPQRQYVANILSQKFALNGSYAIYLFLGDFVDTPEAWSTSPNLVGTHAVFAALRNVDAVSNPISGSTSISAKMPSSMAGDAGIQVTGTMPLTSSLLGKVETGELASMGKDEVEEYLEKNLSWRVGLFDGTQIPISDVQDLEITVVSAEVQPATEADEFPHWGDFTKLTRITQGKPGGCKDDSGND